MASSVSVQLQGKQGLLNKLKLLVPKVREGAKQAVAETALLIESDAKQLAPVDTGRLRSSIHAEIAPDGLSATVSDGVTYGIFIELGTRRQKAQPFLGPAYEMNRLAFIANLKKNTQLFR